MKLIHLTDTHFVPEGKELYGRDPSIALHKAIQDINLNHADAEMMVITGDLTHWGEPDAFTHLRRALETLSMALIHKGWSHFLDLEREGCGPLARRAPGHGSSDRPPAPPWVPPLGGRMQDTSPRWAARR